MNNFSEIIQNSHHSLKQGDIHAAYQTLLPVISYPSRLDDQELFVNAFSVFVEIARKFAGDEFAEKIRAICQDPHDVNHLYDAAYSLYEQRQFPIAATLLFRANQLAPKQPGIVTELSSNLEEMLAYCDAALMIDSSGLADHDPMCTYLSAFNWMMAGELDRAQQRFQQLKDVSDPNLVFMREAIGSILTRAHIITKTKAFTQDPLTSWHAAINGTLLLHESPFGFEESMRGRYAYVSDSASRMKEGLERLGILLSNRMPSKIIAAPDRASKILARAASLMFQRPYEDWKGDSPSDSLIVVWDLDAVKNNDFLENFANHSPSQILFAHASNWVNPFHYAPDITTFLYQTVTHPYVGGSMNIDPVTNSPSKAPPDARSDEEIAQEILKSPINDPSHSSIESLKEIVQASSGLTELSTLGIFRSQGSRFKQRAGSPIRSARFN